MVEKWPKWPKNCRNYVKMAKMAEKLPKWWENGQNGGKIAEMVGKWRKNGKKLHEKTIMWAIQGQARYLAYISVKNEVFNQQA